MGFVSFFEDGRRNKAGFLVRVIKGLAVAARRGFYVGHGTISANHVVICVLGKFKMKKIQNVTCFMNRGGSLSCVLAGFWGDGGRILRILDPNRALEYATFVRNEKMSRQIFTPALVSACFGQKWIFRSAAPNFNNGPLIIKIPFPMQ